MQSEAGIISAALVHLGRDMVADPAAEGEPVANMMLERYPAVRDSLLRSYPWNFALRFASLAGAALPTALFGYGYRCPLPAGGAHPYCLRVLKVDTTAKYQVSGRDLYLTAAPPVTISYTARITDPEQFDPLWYELVALDLALATIGRVAGGEDKRRAGELTRARRELRRDAIRQDAQEQSAPELAGGSLGSWLGARRVL